MKTILALLAIPDDFSDSLFTFLLFSQHQDGTGTYVAAQYPDNGIPIGTIINERRWHFTNASKHSGPVLLLHNATRNSMHLRRNIPVNCQVSQCHQSEASM
jgi:hypothetical protein